ncbi:MAG: hydroxysqualene dehydroxylase HpnE [Acidobacteriota bacterium]|nr:hydroxysqualene dehydroxylase HpnE [Acidobacteriota bacterium]
MKALSKVIVAGGGLAGLASAAALGAAGFEVDLFESRDFLGGRATSWPVSPEAEIIDNCQHVLLRCCVNLIDFYGRLGVAQKIRFYSKFYFIEPGGRMSVLERGKLAAPNHFTSSFLKMKCLGIADKAGIARAMLAIPRERLRRTDLDRINMLEWLKEKRQTPRAIERYWRQLLVSAVNEELDRMAAVHGFQVVWLGMLARADSYEMGIPDVPLRSLYAMDAWEKIGRVTIHRRCPVQEIAIENGRVLGVRAAGQLQIADRYISALPFERIGSIVPGLALDTTAFEHSPITGIHLWFDRPITALPHATLLDRTVQWMFNKFEGRYLQLVVSASRSLTNRGREEIVALALKELGEFFPRAREAKLERAHVIKEVRATYSAKPGMESLRPPARTAIPNLFLAGDWTRSGWPATMEGSVRSGYLAAEGVAQAAGDPKRFLLPDIA